MRLGLAATLSFLVIAAAASVVFAQDPYNPRPGAVACQTKIGIERSGTLNVYQVGVPSDAVICVNYSFNSFGVGSSRSDYGPINGSSFSACGASNGTEFSTCPRLRIAASPQTASHLPDQVITIAYKVSASDGLKNGTYWFFIESCTPIVLVVGSIPPYISSLATGDALGCVSIEGRPTSSQVAGVTNINVVAIPIEDFRGAVDPHPCP